MMPTSPAGSARRRGRAEAGFTLVELMVVLTVVALVGTFATPMLLSSLPGRELRAEAEALRSELRLARSSAVRESRETWVTVDVAGRSYAASGTRRAHRLPEDVAVSLEAARREQVAQSQARIRFFPDGTSTGGAVLLRRAGHAQKVSVDWFDGRVSLDAAPPG